MTDTGETGHGGDASDWRGRIGAIGGAELDEFLALGILCHLGCLTGEGTPYVVPVWFEWDGSTFWVIPRKRSRWATYLQRRPSVSLAISEPQAPYRKVQAQGTAVIVEEPNVGGAWVAIANRMALRYLGEYGPDYLVPTLDQPRWLIRVDVARLTTWQGVAWHPRYVEPT